MKDYENARGKAALKFLRVLEKFVENFDVDAYLVPYFDDVELVKNEARFVKILFNVSTMQLPPVVMNSDGLLLNHPEHPLTDRQIGEYLSMDLGEKILCLSCNRKIQTEGADFIAIEPCDYIGTNSCVLDDDPNFLRPYIDKYENLLVGAGISHREDVDRVMGEGARGVLIASSVVLADDPYEKLCELFESFGKGRSIKS